MEKLGIFWLLKATTLLICCTIIFWYLKFHREKRRMDKILAKIPGPKGYPIIGNAIDFIGGTSTSVILDTLMRYFSTYPDIFKFRVGPKLQLGVSKPEYLEIILNHPECLNKGNQYAIMEPFLGYGLVTAPVNVWRRNRKLINRAFSQKILDSFVVVFNDYAKILINILKEETGKKIDIFDDISACNVDTICETAMGVKVNAQTTETNNNHYGKILDSLMEIACYKMFHPWLNNELIFRLSRHGKIAYSQLATLIQFTTDIIVEKRKRFSDRKRRIENGEIIEENSKLKTFLEILLELSDGNEEYTNKELMDEVNTFTAAGSDTTAASICFCCITLALHPEIQEKLYREVLDVLGKDREATPKDLPALHYMARFIKETLRLFPVAPIIYRSPTKDIDLGDVIIPANSSILIAMISLHRSPKYWKDPLKFDPDRFLPEEMAKRHPYSYLPFSGGPRGCIGSKYGEMAMKTILCMLIRKFIFKTEYKSIEDIELKMNILLRPLNGFKVSLQVRE